MKKAGAAIIFFGFLFFLGTVRIPFGLALMFFGTLLVIFGGRREEEEVTADDLELMLALTPKQRDIPPNDTLVEAPKVRQDAIKDFFADGVTFLIGLAERWATSGIKTVNVIAGSLNRSHFFHSAARDVAHEQPRKDRPKSRHAPLVRPTPLDIPPRREPMYGVARVPNEKAVDGFDRREWQALLKQDNELAQVAARLSSGLGNKWVDELARLYLARNDKAYLPDIITQIIAHAGKEHGVA